MPITPTQVAVFVTILVAVGFLWRIGGGRWRSLAEDRLLYGVPWGTLVTVAIVVAFYSLAQAGLRDWSDPVTLPYVTWSYFYPTGLLTAGIAHGSPGHIASNMAATLAFAPIAEYVWSHYAPSRRSGGPGSASGASGTGDRSGGDGLLARPWIRAVVVFPGMLLAAAFLTSTFGLGPGLGFSGAVFAIVGFAVVTYPIAAVLAAVAASALQTLYLALSEPVLRETISTGPPEPPAWAGIGFQAHLLGFLLGVLCGAVLLRRRNVRPPAQRVFFATLLLGLVQSLWLLVWIGENDTFVLYRGAGVAFVLVLTMAVTVAIAGSDRPLPGPLSIATRILPARVSAGQIRRGAVLAILLSVTVLVALPSVPLNLFVVGADAVPGSGGVDVGGYTVTYEEDAASGQRPIVDPGDLDEEEAVLQPTQDGLIVVNSDREIWTVAERADVIAHDGTASVELGGIGWRETVEAERTGWDVVGNESAYAVDLTVDGETTRSFATDPIRAGVTIDGRAIAVVATDDDFRLRVLDADNGSVVGETLIPEVGETGSVGAIEFSTEELENDSGDGGNGDDPTVRVFASSNGTEVLVAERERYAD
ncbi:rhomboid family intramembrane serine protease [Halosolutus gelatinilyticus]|uniref:rhomboid family intramembrane serine protease n=1 Tax=Halosolutus gelatinilyticus TaxID=2931975 RepID=UPI001FF55B95|nr:rhomboid family intramembrane serine protease [Halosolutus gelatinilyticus]